VFEASIERLRAAAGESTDAQVVAGVRRSIAISIDNLGSIEHELGDDLEALARYREALEMNRERNDPHGVAMNELHISIIEAEAGRFDVARTLLSRSLQVYRSVGFRQYAAESLETASIVANGLGAPSEAAFLLGAASRLRDDAGAPPVPFMARLRERESEVARRALGPAIFDELVDGARRTQSDASLQRAIDFLERSSEP
jgi:tetratricopeptide (TPR) repeat protein